MTNVSSVAAQKERSRLDVLNSLLAQDLPDGDFPYSGRDIHFILDVKTPYMQWFRYSVNGYNAVEGEDYTTMKYSGRDKTIKKIHHFVSTGFALKLGNYSRSTKGRIFGKHLLHEMCSYEEQLKVYQETGYLRERKPKLKEYLSHYLPHANTRYVQIVELLSESHLEDLKRRNEYKPVSEIIEDIIGDLENNFFRSV